MRDAIQRVLHTSTKYFELAPRPLTPGLVQRPGRPGAAHRERGAGLLQQGRSRGDLLSLCATVPLR